MLGWERGGGEEERRRKEDEEERRRKKEEEELSCLRFWYLSALPSPYVIDQEEMCTGIVGRWETSQSQKQKAFKPGCERPGLCSLREMRQLFHPHSQESRDFIVWLPEKKETMRPAFNSPIPLTSIMSTYVHSRRNTAFFPLQ